MKSVATILFLAIWLPYGYCQLHHFKLEEDRNLPSNSVYGICEDVQGRIWICTDNGVAYLQNYFFHKIASDSLPVLALRVYPCRDSGVVLIGNNPNSVFKVYSSGEYHKFDIPDVSRFPGGHISYSINDETIYFSNWQKLFSISENGWTDLAKVKGSGLYSIETDNIGNPILNRDNGVFVFSDGQMHQKSSSKSSTCCFLNDTEFISINQKQICHYKDGLKLWTTTPHNIDDEQPSNARRWGRSTVFTGNQTGLFEYNLDTRAVTNLGQLLEMTSTQFTYTFVDSKNNLWCATNGDGIVVIPKYPFLKSFNQADGLNDNAFYSIAPVGRDSTYILGQKDFYKISGGHLEQLSDNGNPLIYPNETEIRDMITVNGKRIFGISLSSGYSQIPKMGPYGFSVTGSYLHFDGKSLYTGGWGTFLVMDVDIKESTVSFQNRDVVRRSSIGRITRMLQIEDDLFFTADGGIFKYSNESSELSRFDIPEEPAGYFIDLAEDTDGKLWACSKHNVYRKEENTWNIRYDLADLRSRLITGMVIDDDNNLWIATEDGLINIVNGKSSRITMVNGLCSNRINELEYNPADSTLWIGTRRGITALNVEKSILAKRFRHELEIKGIKSGGTILNKADSPHQIKSSELNIEIKFGLKHYFGLASPEYRYRLPQFNAKWAYTDEQQAQYQSLAPGNYTFEVQCSTPGYQWSGSELLHFSVIPPFYQRWEFLLGLSIIIIIVINLIYFLRIRYINARNEENKQIASRMNQLELQALNANMNPHFIFNSLNSIQHYLLPLKNMAAVEHVANISKLIRLNMQAVGKKLVHLKGELERTELYIKLEQERLETNLNYDIETRLHTNAFELWIPSMIIQPAVENAIWHGIMPSKRPGSIKIMVSQQEEFLHITVTDNGVGLTASKANKEKEHESMGTNLTFERLRLHNAQNEFIIEELFDATGKVTGTRVSIKVMTAKKG